MVIDPAAVGAADFNDGIRPGASIAEIGGVGLAGAAVNKRPGRIVAHGDLEFDAGAGRLGALPDNIVESALFFHIKRNGFDLAFDAASPPRCFNLIIRNAAKAGAGAVEADPADRVIPGVAIEIAAAVDCHLIIRAGADAEVGATETDPTDGVVPSVAGKIAVGRRHASCADSGAIANLILADPANVAARRGGAIKGKYADGRAGVTSQLFAFDLNGISGVKIKPANRVVPCPTVGRIDISRGFSNPASPKSGPEKKKKRQDDFEN